VFKFAVHFLEFQRQLLGAHHGERVALQVQRDQFVSQCADEFGAHVPTQIVFLQVDYLGLVFLRHRFPRLQQGLDAVGPDLPGDCGFFSADDAPRGWQQLFAFAFVELHCVLVLLLLKHCLLVVYALQVSLIVLKVDSRLFCKFFLRLEIVFFKNYSIQLIDLFRGFQRGNFVVEEFVFGSVVIVLVVLVVFL